MENCVETKLYLSDFLLRFTGRMKSPLAEFKCFKIIYTKREEPLPFSFSYWS